MTDGNNTPEDNPAIQTTGWGAIDTSLGEEDFNAVNPEQKAENERVAARKNAAAHVVDTLIPSKSIHDDLEAQAKAQALFKKERLFKAAFAEQLAKTNIPETDLREYGSSVYAATREITAPSQEISIYTLRAFVDNSESLEQARLYAQLAHQWNERFLSTAPDDRVWRNRVNNFSRFVSETSGTHKMPKPEPRSTEETTALFESMAEVYDAAYALPENEDNQRIFNTLTNGARDLGLRTHDPDQIQKTLQIYREVADEPNKKLAERIMDTVIRYGRTHGLTEDAAQGFVQKLLPAMRSNDSQVAILTKGGNIWGMRPGDFGAGDFLAHAYALRVTPAHVNELLMAAREVPTTDLARLERNRLDALTLAAPFGALRDFVHDQRPYVHEVIEAMVKYYDTGDSKQLLSVLDKVDPGYLGSEDRRACLLDKNSYDTPNNETVKPIDVLRRLNENTKPVEETPPVTSDETLNQLLQGLAENDNQVNLQQALDYTNHRLIAIMQEGEIGLEPNLILAFAFLDKKGFQALQKLKYEDQQSAYRQGWFYSVLRFQELTASANNYDERNFQQFLNQITNSESPQAAYRLITRRELENASKLARIYKKSGKENSVGALWSGNITHELIGLTNLRPAITEQGRKAVIEANKRVSEPGYHPGD